ncbi:MAG TPA: hypothetical protein VFP68_01340 [Burkholderiaceae bacterium]|nr:hypothetical protein [Burkholderiaceae bacterium]
MDFLIKTLKRAGLPCSDETAVSTSQTIRRPQRGSSSFNGLSGQPLTSRGRRHANGQNAGGIDFQTAANAAYGFVGHFNDDAPPIEANIPSSPPPAAGARAAARQDDPARLPRNQQRQARAQLPQPERDQQRQTPPDRPDAEDFRQSHFWMPEPPPGEPASPEYGIPAVSEIGDDDFSGTPPRVGTGAESGWTLPTELKDAWNDVAGPSSSNYPYRPTQERKSSAHLERQRVSERPPSDATSETLKLPASPAQAPTVLRFNRMNSDFNRLTELTFSSNPQVQFGAAIISEPNGRLKLINEVKGDSQKSTVKVRLTEEGQKLQGFFHTHTEWGLSFSPFEVAAQINDGSNVEILQSGRKQFLLLRTENTPSRVNAIDLKQRGMRLMDELGRAGISRADISVMFCKGIAAEYHLAFYEGNQGVLRRLQPPA